MATIEKLHKSKHDMTKDELKLSVHQLQNLTQKESPALKSLIEKKIGYKFIVKNNHKH